MASYDEELLKKYYSLDIDFDETISPIITKGTDITKYVAPSLLDKLPSKNITEDQYINSYYQYININENNNSANLIRQLYNIRVGTLNVHGYKDSADKIIN